MVFQSKAKINVFTNITTALVAVVVFVFSLACNKTGPEVVKLKFDPETMPSMVTENAVTFISDSGTTRYKLEAKVWQVFDKAFEPFWLFPQGIYLERFNPDFSIEAIVEADTAWNYTSLKLWKLKGNVFVRNMQGDKFKSDELYWDQIKRKVYSEKYIEIKSGLTELKGYGFESNQEMTDYKIFQPHDGKIPFEYEQTDSPDMMWMDDAVEQTDQEIETK